MMKKRFWGILGAVIASPILFISGISAQTKDNKATIQNGSHVTFEYTLKDDQGNQIESSKGKAPLTYTHGSKQIIPGLENKLQGMSVGDEKSIRVAPACPWPGLCRYSAR